MSWLMSVAHTEAQVRDRSKTVTRRLGWRKLRPGHEVTLCPKVMGRRRRCPWCSASEGGRTRERCARCGWSGYVVDPLDRIVTVIVLSAFREPLDLITPSDVVAEGFPDWTPEQFIDFYVRTFKVDREQELTRIEWRYPA